MGAMAVLLTGAILMTGCVTEKKVKKYLDKNPLVGSEYCAETYPIIETTDTTVVVDSTTYKDAYEYLVKFSDSLLYELSQAPDTISIEKVKESIRTEIKYRLKPCLDSTILIQKTKESTAKVKHLEELLRLKDKRIEEKDDVISKRDQRITQLEDKVSNLKKQKLWLIILLIISVLFVNLSMWKLILTLLILLAFFGGCLIIAMTQMIGEDIKDSNKPKSNE
jgi:hypothetical protein